MIFAFFKTVTLGLTLINAAIQYREKRKAEEEAEEERRESYADPSAPIVDEKSPIPVVFGTVELTGPNVVFVDRRFFDESSPAFPLRLPMARPNATDYISDGIDDGHQELYVHLVFCRGPVDEVLELRSGDHRLGVVPIGPGFDPEDVTTSWNLRDHYEFEGESIVNAAGYFDNAVGADRYEGPAKWGQAPWPQRDETATWDDFRWLNGFPSQQPDEDLEYQAGDPTGSALEPDVEPRDLPAYRGLFGCVGLLVWPFGERLDETSVVVRRNTVGSFGRNLAAAFPGVITGPGGTMNGAAIVWEALTDEDWGAAVPEEHISDLHFDYAAAHTEGLSFVWSDREEYSDLIAEVIRHTDSALYVEPTTAQVVLRVIRDDYDLDAMEQQAGDYSTKPILTLTPENIIAVRESSTQTKSLVNEVTVVYPDREAGRDRAITEHDTASQRFRGPIEQEVQYPFVDDAGLAARLAARDLNQLGQPLRSFEIELPASVAQDIRPADVAVLTWPDFGIEEMVIRVTGYTSANVDDQMVTIEARQDVFAAQDAITGTPDDIIVPDLNPDPEPAAAVYATEVPFWFYVQWARQNGQESAVEDIADSVPRRRGQVMMAAHTEQIEATSWDLYTESIDVDIEVSPGSIARQNLFTEEVELSFSQDLNQVEDTDPGGLVIAGRREWETHVFFEIDGVIIAATDFDGDTAQRVEFGWFDTTPYYPTASFDGTALPIGYGRYIDDEDEMVLRMETNANQPAQSRSRIAVDAPNRTDVAPRRIHARCLPTTSGGTLPPGAIDELEEVQLNRRMARPYAPGNLDTEQNDDPGEFGGWVRFSWSGRDRMGRQTDQTDPEHMQPDGVKWRLNIYSADSSLDPEHHLLEDEIIDVTEDDYQWDNQAEADAMEAATGTAQLADRLIFEIDAVPEDDTSDFFSSWQRNRYLYDRT